MYQQRPPGAAPAWLTRLGNVMLFVGLIAFLAGLAGVFSEGPQRTVLAGLIGLVVGAVLIAGSFPVRKTARAAIRYLVTKPADPLATVLFGLSVLALLAVAWLVGYAVQEWADSSSSLRGLRSARGWFFIVILAVLPFISALYHKRRTALHVDGSGVYIAGVPLVWTDLAQLVVAYSPSGHHVLIGARLLAGRWLPAGVVAPVVDPRFPAPVQVAVERHKFDLTQLTAKVRQFGPPYVPVLAASPAGEYRVG